MVPGLAQKGQSTSGTMFRIGAEEVPGKAALAKGETVASPGLAAPCGVDSP